MADAPNSDFDRWVEGSPDVKANDEAAFAAALEQGMADCAQHQREAAAFQGGDMPHETGVGEY